MPYQQVNPCRHHGGRVDQGRYRGRAGHGIGQPDHQRQLGTLTHGANQQEEASQGKGSKAITARRYLLRQLGDGEGTEHAPQEAHGQQKAQVADAVDDEGLTGRVGVEALLIPEADEQVGGQTHPLPANEHHRQTVAQDEQQHGRDEQVEITEEAAIAGVAVHVTDGPEVNQEAHPGHHHQHHARKVVEVEAKRDSR
jgi:hypothetical protein